jgi:signal transduction histidine kinase
LVSNALKFTSKGKVEVNVVGLEQRAASCLQILEEFDNEDRNKATITFEVRDTGLGIKPKDINKLFSMFGKLDDEEGINKNGCGLGLTICKRLTEQLGGDISVTSIEGKGSTFTFSIKVELRPHEKVRHKVASSNSEHSIEKKDNSS